MLSCCGQHVTLMLQGNVSVLTVQVAVWCADLTCDDMPLLVSYLATTPHLRSLSITVKAQTEAEQAAQATAPAGLPLQPQPLQPQLQPPQHMRATAQQLHTRLSNFVRQLFTRGNMATGTVSGQSQKTWS